MENTTLIDSPVLRTGEGMGGGLSRFSSDENGTAPCEVRGLRGCATAWNKQCAASPNPASAKQRHTTGAYVPASFQLRCRFRQKRSHRALGVGGVQFPALRWQRCAELARPVVHPQMGKRAVRNAETAHRRRRKPCRGNPGSGRQGQSPATAPTPARGRHGSFSYFTLHPNASVCSFGGFSPFSTASSASRR
jgi:hypothetical protein